MALGPEARAISKRQDQLLNHFVSRIDSSIRRGVHVDIRVSTGPILFLYTFRLYDYRDFTDELFDRLRSRYLGSGWKEVEIKPVLDAYMITLKK